MEKSLATIAASGVPLQGRLDAFKTEFETKFAPPVVLAAITINEGATAGAVAGLRIAASSENSTRAELEAGELVRVLPDWDFRLDGSECALRQRKDHKACRTRTCRLPSQGAPCCLGRLRPGHRRDGAAFPAVIDTIPLPHHRRNLTLAKHAPPTVRPRAGVLHALRCRVRERSEIPETCKRARARHDGKAPMAKVLVLYYSSYGHIEKLAHEIAAGAREAGASADVKRVPELLSPEAAKAANYKLDQTAPVARIDDLAEYDAIVVGTGTRFGRMSSQMASFLDQAGGLWAKGALHGKVGGAFASSATQHGGQETTLFTIITNLLHFGMTVVGLNYGFAGQMKVNEITGGTPYGATTIAGPDAQRQPSKNELAGARYQGRAIAETAAKLHG